MLHSLSIGEVRAPRDSSISRRNIYGDSAIARQLMDACRALGAIEVLGPNNDPNHFDHIHCAW